MDGFAVIQELTASGRQHGSIPGETSHNQTLRVLLVGRGFRDSNSVLPTRALTFRFGSVRSLPRLPDTGWLAGVGRNVRAVFNN